MCSLTTGGGVFGDDPMFGAKLDATPRCAQRAGT